MIILAQSQKKGKDVIWKQSLGRNVAVIQHIKLALSWLYHTLIVFANNGRFLKGKEN